MCVCVCVRGGWGCIIMCKHTHNTNAPTHTLIHTHARAHTHTHTRTHARTHTNTHTHRFPRTPTDRKLAAESALIPRLRAGEFTECFSVTGFCLLSACLLLLFLLQRAPACCCQGISLEICRRGSSEELRASHDNRGRVIRRAKCYRRGLKRSTLQPLGVSYW